MNSMVTDGSKTIRTVVDSLRACGVEPDALVRMLAGLLMNQAVAVYGTKGASERLRRMADAIEGQK